MKFKTRKVSDYYDLPYVEVDFNTLEELEAWTLEQKYEDYRGCCEGCIIVDFIEKEIAIYDAYVE